MEITFSREDLVIKPALYPGAPALSHPGVFGPEGPSPAGWKTFVSM